VSENATARNFATEVLWYVAVIIVGGILIYGVKKVARTSFALTTSLFRKESPA